VLVVLIVLFDYMYCFAKFRSTLDMNVIMWSSFHDTACFVHRLPYMVTWICYIESTLWRGYPC